MSSNSRVVVDHDVAIVGVELLADDPHGELGLAVQQRRRLGLGGLGGDRFPLLEQQPHVGAQLLLGGVLGGGAHDEAVLGRLHPVEDRSQPLAHVVGQALGDPVRLRVGDQHHVAARQRHLLGEPCPLGADRVLRHLADDQLAGAQDLLDPRVRLLDVLGVVLHVAAVEHGVLRRGDVDERRLHAGQHVLDPPDVDVAVDLADVVGGPRHVVLDEVAALQHGDLGHARHGPGRTSCSARSAGRCARRAAAIAPASTTAPVALARPDATRHVHAMVCLRRDVLRRGRLGAGAVGSGSAGGAGRVSPICGLRTSVRSATSGVEPPSRGSLGQLGLVGGRRRRHARARVAVAARRRRAS